MKRKQKKKSGGEDDEDLEIWVPPAELLEDDDDELDADDVDAEEKGSDSAEIIVRKGDKRTKKMDKKHTMITSNKTKRDVEEDNLSDLIGSDHDDDEVDIIVAPLKKGGRSSNEALDFDTVGDDDETEVADEDEEEPRMKKSKKGIVGKKRKATDTIEKKKEDKQRKQNKA